MRIANGSCTLPAKWRKNTLEIRCCQRNRCGRKVKYERRRRFIENLLYFRENCNCIRSQLMNVDAESFRFERSSTLHRLSHCPMTCCLEKEISNWNFIVLLIRLWILNAPWGQPLSFLVAPRSEIMRIWIRERKRELPMASTYEQNRIQQCGRGTINDVVQFIFNGVDMRFEFFILIILRAKMEWAPLKIVMRTPQLCTMTACQQLLSARKSTTSFSSVDDNFIAFHFCYDDSALGTWCNRVTASIKTIFNVTNRERNLNGTWDECFRELHLSIAPRRD